MRTDIIFVHVYVDRGATTHSINVMSSSSNSLKPGDLNIHEKNLFNISLTYCHSPPIKRKDIKKTLVPHLNKELILHLPYLCVILHILKH